MIYNLLEVVLSRSCAIVNDFILLSIDVIRAAAVNRGEKTFTELADRGPFGGGDGQWIIMAFFFVTELPLC